MSLSKAACSLHHGDHSQDETTIKRFDLKRTEVYALINEINLAKKCCEHANILPSIRSTFYQNQDELCLVLPRLNKAYTCFSIFKNGLPANIVAYVIMETLVALDYMHVRGGRVHGNLDSKNVFFDQQASVKLAFPTWLINESETILYPSNLDTNRKCDIKMVGLLAMNLFFGESLERKCLGCIPSIIQKKLPKPLKDFIEFCKDSSRGGPVTINELMQHVFFSKFCEFNRYKEDLKKLISIRAQNYLSKK